MAFTSLKGLSVQSAGANSGTWGAGGAGYDLNTGVMGVLDLNLAGVFSTSLSSSNVTLSATDTQNCMLRFSGLLLANIVASPGVGVLFNGFYYFENLTTGNFSVTVTTGVGSVVLPQTRRGIMFVDSTNGPRIVSIVGVAVADPIPVGTVMLFYQDAAPTGWTIVSSLNNYGLKIVSSAGGVTSGSVSYATLFGRTTTDSHTLTTVQIPSHTHTVSAYNTLISGGAAADVYFTIPSASTITSSATGGGLGHTHNIDMRVQTAHVILCSKN